MLFGFEVYKKPALAVWVVLEVLATPMLLLHWRFPLGGAGCLMKTSTIQSEAEELARKKALGIAIPKKGGITIHDQDKVLNPRP